MKKLTNYQVKILTAGAKEEKEKDIRVHSGEKQETARLLDMLDRYQGQVIYNNIVDALLSLFHFWNIYFTCGAEKAFTVKEIEDQAFRVELTAEIEGLEKTMLENLEKRKAAAAEGKIG